MTEEDCRLPNRLQRRKQAAETICQALIDAKLSAVIGACPHERTETRSNQRKGSRPRTLTSIAGDWNCGFPSCDRHGDLQGSPLPGTDHLELSAERISDGLAGRTAVMTAPPPPPHPLRQLFSLRKVPRRWIFAVRAGVCMAMPVAVGWALGDVPAGLTASLGAFTSLYGSGRPYLHRSVHLGVIAVCFAAAVALGDWSGQLAWAGVLTVSAIAMVAVLFCNALRVGPPGAYMFVMACAAGIGLATQHLSPWRTGLLVLGGGAFSWLVHMSGTLGGFRRPERSAVMAAADAAAVYLNAIGTAAERSARHRAALALHHSWGVLVNFQPRAHKPGRSLQRFRLINRELHAVFADAMGAAAKNGSVPADTSQRVHRLRALAADPAASDGLASADIPPGHPGAGELVRQALRPGSRVLPVVIRVGIAVVIAGFVAAAAGVE